MSYVTVFPCKSRNLVQVARILGHNFQFNRTICATKGVVQAQQKRCYSTDNSGDRDENSSEISETETDTKFSLQVAKHALQQGLTIDSEKNMMCSPMSIDALLSMIAVGAKGQLQTQFRKLLGYDTIEDLNAAAVRLASVVQNSEGTNAPKIAFANALLLDKQLSLNSTFENMIRDSHSAEVRPVDFTQAEQVVKEVNLWAEAKTRGLIKKVLAPSSIDAITNMLFANALYFKGTWSDEFVQEYTKDDDFHLLNGDKVRVPFMNKRGKSFLYGTFDGCQVLKMPYKQGTFALGEKQKRFSMYIFLPQEKDGLMNLLNNIKIDTNTFWHKLELSSRKIALLSIPKFKFECHVALSEHMKELGLTLPFDRNCKDLLGMFDNLDEIEGMVYVQDLLQKCFVETNERGTEAASVTYGYGVGRARGQPLPPVNFVADHPFMFMIREDYSGDILFAGTMLNPINK